MAAPDGRASVGSLLYWCGKLQELPDVVLNNPEVRQTLHKLDRDLDSLDTLIEDIDPVTGELKDTV